MGSQISIIATMISESGEDQSSKGWNQRMDICLTIHRKKGHHKNNMILKARVMLELIFKWEVGSCEIGEWIVMKCGGRWLWKTVIKWGSG